MSKSVAKLDNETKLLLLARSRWTRRVLEEQLMPALGRKVPLFATAQVSGTTTRMQTFDPASLELTWHEVTCSVTARAVRFVQRLPRWRSTPDAVILAEEMRAGTFEELRIAHHVMHTLDVPATSLEVAHRLAHLAPDAAALLGRALSMESQLRHIGNALNYVAQRTASLFSHVGLAVGLTCLVLNSMALNQAIKRHDEVTKASLASSVALDAASCTLFTSALVAVTLKASHLAAALSTAAIPVSLAALAVPPLVRHFCTKRKASELACARLGAVIEGLQQPLQLDESLGAHHFCPLVPVSVIDFRTCSYTLGSVAIEGNQTFLLNAPRKSKDVLDMLDALELVREQSLNGTEQTMVLPVSGDQNLSWEVHFTATAFAAVSCPGINEVSKLREKGFSFYNGLYTVHDVQTSIDDGSITVLLDNQDRTFAIAPKDWFPEQADGKIYDMCYTLVGSGGKTVVQMESRLSGYNIVRLETDSENVCSTWILRCNSKLSLVYYNKDKFIFSGDGVNVVLTEPEKNLLFIALNEVIFAFNCELKTFVPKIIMGSWIKQNKEDIGAKLRKFNCALEIQDVICVDEDEKEILGASVYYNPSLDIIEAVTSNGLLYTSGGAVDEDEALIFTLESVDLSLQLPNVDFNILHRLTKDRLSVWVSHLNLQGYFDAKLGLLLLLSDSRQLYTFSHSTAAVVGVGKAFLESPKLCERVNQLSTSLTSDPVLKLFPRKQHLIAEHLLVLDTLNLWILPFEQKIASAMELSATLQIVGTVQDSAVFFNQVDGSIYTSPLIPLDSDCASVPPPALFHFQGFGRFIKVDRAGGENILATTKDGLVFHISDAEQMDLQEKIIQECDSYSSLCLRAMNVAERKLVPITEETTGLILYFVDTQRGNIIEALGDHTASEINYLGRTPDDCHYIFSFNLKKVIKVSPNSPPSPLINCDFAVRQENAMLLFEPEPPLNMREIEPLSDLLFLDSLILATSLTSVRLTFNFENWQTKKFILDPLLKTLPVELNINFDTAVTEEKCGNELLLKSGDKVFWVHRGQRENISINLTSTTHLT